MKTHINHCLVAILSLPLAALCHAEETEPLRLPEPLSKLVTKAIEIKTESMKLPGMRSEDGELGKQVEGVMNQIADLASEEIVKQARQAQDHDIRAKIILWAQDRKKRPAEYERFAKFYLNRPVSEKDSQEYFFRPWLHIEQNPYGPPMTPENCVPRPGAWLPHPIDKEDVIEDNRILMEYCFFMPPTGRAFNRDQSRYNLMKSLLSLKMVEKSYKIFTVDSDICFEVSKDRETPGLGQQNREDSNRDGWLALMLIPNRSSFDLLAKYCTHPYGKHWIESGFTYFWGNPDYDNGRAFNNHQEWISLTKQELPEIHQQNFAKFLLSLPTPEKLVHPNSVDREN